MVCGHCAEALSGQDRFCTSCGASVQESGQGTDVKNAKGLIGFSHKINDPAFARYVKDSNRWSLIFSLVIAAAAVIGFYIYGETSYEMDNPQALLIGLGIGGMFVLIALFQILGRKRSTTWDGTVVDKKIEHKKRKQGPRDNWYWQKYTLYTVVVRSDRGKTYELTAEDDDTLYNYWKIGDRLRHHAGLNYEKYDKSKDEIIFCNACASLNDINDDYCHRCKCPLLK